jgi:hypothetical protein
MSMLGFNAAARTLAVTALGLTAFVQPGAAQTYPSQNVTVVVAFPAGGLADIIARLASTKLAERMKIAAAPAATSQPRPWRAPHRTVIRCSSPHRVWRRI